MAHLALSLLLPVLFCCAKSSARLGCEGPACYLDIATNMDDDSDMSSLLQLDAGLRTNASSLVRMRSTALASLLEDSALGRGSDQQATGTCYGGIPKRIHSTWQAYSNLKPKERAYVRLWRKANPDFTYHFWNDSSAESFLSMYAPEDREMLREMKPIERFDYFRYAVLDEYGGVYHDIDVHPMKRVRDWLQDGGEKARLITGWEMRLHNESQRIARNFSRVDQVQQWTMAAAPGHPVLKQTLGHIRRDFAAGRPGDAGDTLSYTGPGAWTDAVLSYVGKIPPASRSGYGIANRILKKDVALMEVEAFSYCGEEISPDRRPRRLVKHHYKGSWRGKH